MASRRRIHHFSKRMLGGILFVLTSFVGGFVASVGAAFYSFVKGVFSVIGMPFNVAQIAFLSIGVIGLFLILSDIMNVQKSPNRKKG